MSAWGAVPERLSRLAHPRLALLALLGAAVGVGGTLLAVAGPAVGRDLATLGTRLAVIGYLAFLVGGSGYLAFTAFERGFD